MPDNLRLVPPVEIVEPSSGWPAEFEAIARALRACLGPLAWRIDHIGSTSVPQLPAKDIIDVQVTVDSLDLEQLRPLFLHAGYQHCTDVNRYDHRPPGVESPQEDWAKLLFTPAAGQRDANIHVRLAGRPNQRYALLFRDYLRAHNSTATAYAELKRRLATLGIERSVYADTKDPACDIIMAAAEDWARECSWRPGPSDA